MILRLIALFSISIAVIGCQASNQLTPLSQVKAGVAEEGTLANAILIQDTESALRKVSGLPESKIIKFIIQQPVGKPGLKAWREIWVTNPDSNPQQYIITFKEDGAGSANFEIQTM